MAFLPQFGPGIYCKTSFFLFVFVFVFHMIFGFLEHLVRGPPESHEKHSPWPSMGKLPCASIYSGAASGAVQPCAAEGTLVWFYSQD